MDPNQSSGVKTWQWVVTVIVIIALIIIGIFVFGGKKAVAPNTNEPVATDTSAPTSSGIIMSDQFPGNVVYVSSVQASQPVWVEIHEDNNGQPGAYIGSQLFQPGVTPGKITLTKPTVDGRLYYAMLHSDDGDGKFDASKDLPLKDANGNIIMKPFRATVSANNQIKG
jgi:hypothetical protein